MQKARVKISKWNMTFLSSFDCCEVCQKVATVVNLQKVDSRYA